MEQETSQQFAERMKSSPERAHKVKAEIIRVEKEYILSKEGEEGLNKVSERMKELGAELDFKKLDSQTWEEEWKNSLLIVVAKETFNWTDEDIFQMGRFSPRASFFIKSIIQYLVSIDVVFNNVSNYWHKHHDFGDLEPVEINKEEKYIVIRKVGFRTHPIMCIYHAGYFKGVVEFVLRSDNINVDETKCMHKGDDYHEYRITW